MAIGALTAALIGGGLGFGASQLFGGSEGSAEAVDLLTAEERKLRDQIATWLQGYVGQGAEPYAGQLVADIPDLFAQAYEQYAASFEGDLGRATTEATLGMIRGEPAYTFDPAATAERWEETYAGPVMEAWRSHVLPGIKEGFNIPGVMYSRGAGRGVGRAAGEFFGQQVAPTLFGALQTGERMGFESLTQARTMQPGALGLPFTQFTQAAGAAGSLQQLVQQQLTAQYQEFLRTRAEPGWAAKTGLQIQPTQDVVGFQGYNPIGDIAQLALAAASLWSK